LHSDEILTGNKIGVEGLASERAHL